MPRKRGNKENPIKKIEKSIEKTGKTIEKNIENRAGYILSGITNGIKHPAYATTRTFGQKAADKLTTFAGSWTFIIILGIFIVAWIYLNVTAYVKQWDPWPFIILNLCLSCLAAVQAPIILLSQNRESQRDRLRSEYDYKINKKAEREIQEIQKDIKEIKRMVKRR